MTNSPALRSSLFWALCTTSVLALLVLVPLGVVISRLRREASNRVEDALARMRSLDEKRLVLTSARNTDGQLEQIRGMPEIEAVVIEDTDITAVGMRHIATLPNLKHIVAYATVGDEGLLELRNCTSLESVEVYGRGITDEAISELQSYLPNARIGTWRDKDHSDHDRQPE